MTDVEKVVSKARRGGFLFAFTIGAICVIALTALGIAIVNQITNDQQGTTIKRLSSCEHDPSGGTCQDTKRKSDEDRSLSSACILFYKVDRDGELLRFTKCPVPRSTPRGSSSGAATARGDSPTDSSGPVATAPTHESGGGVAPAAHHTGTGDGSAPPDTGTRHEPAPAPSPTSSAPSAESSSTTTTETTREVQTGSTAPGVLPSTVEAAGATVQKTGEVVTGTLEDIGQLGCSLLCQH
jgi:hypothetical protein